MRGRIPLYMLLASALVFLASLFLPWRESTVSSRNFLFSTSPVQGLLTQFAGGTGRVDGWIAIAGDIAVLLVVAIVLAAVVVLRRPQLATRLPIGGLGVALAYFAVAVAHETRTVGSELGLAIRHTLHTRWTYGFYLGLASAGVAAVSALVLRRSEPLQLRGASDALATFLGIGLLISFLLPWVGFVGAADFSLHGIEAPPAAIAALGLILGAGWLHVDAGRRWRLPVAIAAAILSGGAASAVAISGGHVYGTWIGIGCAVALVVLEAVRADGGVRAWPARPPVLPHGVPLVRIGAAALLIVALFLPWQEIDHVGVSYNGWYTSTGAAAGCLCLLLLSTPALPALGGYLLDAVVAVAIFVSMVGTAFRANSPFFGPGYGAYVGFAAAGILLGTVLVPLRPGSVDRERALARALPLAAPILCVAAVVVPLWFLLPQNWTFQSYALYGSMAVPGVLLSLYLVHLWAGRVRRPASTGHGLTLVPLVLLILASLELIRFRDSSDVIWGAIILVALCLVLIVLGWIEENRGLEGVRVPEEIWRVDRLPEAES